MVFLQADFFVPTDGCAWRNAETIEVDPSLEGFVNALATQASSETTSPVEVSLGDYSGLEFDISVRSDVELDDCDEPRSLPRKKCPAIAALVTVVAGMLNASMATPCIQLPSARSCW